MNIDNSEGLIQEIEILHHDQLALAFVVWLESYNHLIPFIFSFR